MFIEDALEALVCCIVKWMEACAVEGSAEECFVIMFFDACVEAVSCGVADAIEVSCSCFIFALMERSELSVEFVNTVA